MKLRTDKEIIKGLKSRLNEVIGNAASDACAFHLQIARIREDNRRLKALLEKNGIEFESTFEDKP